MLNNDDEEQNECEQILQDKHPELFKFMLDHISSFNKFFGKADRSLNIDQYEELNKQYAKKVETIDKDKDKDEKEEDDKPIRQLPNIDDDNED